MDFYNKPSPALFLMHYGVKGMKWGVRRTPEELGYKPKRTVEKTEEPGIIKTTLSGHVSIPKRSTPNSITDHLDSDGKVDSRSFYDENGLKAKESHTTNHGHPKHHDLVPHVHDYQWNEETGKADRIERPLTEAERKENEDIL